MAARRSRSPSPSNSSSDGGHYYCHKCRKTVTGVGSDMMCPECHTGFLELVENPIPRMPDFSRLFRGLAAASTGRRGRGHSPSSGVTAGAGQQSTARGQNIQADQVGPEGVMFQNFLQQLFETITDNNAVNANRHVGHQGPGFHFRVNINGQEVPPEQGFFLNFLQNPGNYVFGDNIDAIVTQLLNQVEGGAPPLAPEAMKKLKKTEVSEENVKNKLQCPVCFENFAVKEQVTVLPCKHTFHNPCITPWLSRHNSCPVCRKPAGEDGTPPPPSEQDASAPGGLALMEDNEFD